MSGSATASRDDGVGAEGWLVRRGDVLASLAPPPSGRIIGRPPQPAVVLRRGGVVHTLTSTGVDVAWCTPATAGELEVRRTRCLARWRIAVAPPGDTVLVVAERGAFERWGLRVGDRLVVHGR